MSPLAEATPKSSAETALSWASRSLVGVVWVSAALFGVYILCFYGGAWIDGAYDQWNTTLPDLYVEGALVSTGAMAVHFLGGGILLLLGPVLLIARVRERHLRLHRLVGRLFGGCAAITGAAGVVFIFIQGTVGGAVMNVGFALYGALMVLCAVLAVVRVRQGRLAEHRAWGVRLFALVIASWLYRMEYGVWITATGGLGHDGTNVDGWFDAFMSFAFYVPNLAIAELFLRGHHARYRQPALTIMAATVMAGAALMVVVGTYYFLLEYWGAPIAARLGL